MVKSDTDRENGLNGAALTNAAFKDAFPVFGGYMLMIGLILFAFTTILE